jgi:hypothetical protein
MLCLTFAVKARSTVGYVFDDRVYGAQLTMLIPEVKFGGVGSECISHKGGVGFEDAIERRKTPLGIRRAVL